MSDKAAAPIGDSWLMDFETQVGTPAYPQPLPVKPLDLRKTGLYLLWAATGFWPNRWVG